MGPTLPMVFLDGPWRMAMGLNRLDLADWLWFDDQAEAELAEKRRLLARHPEAVLAGLPEAGPAARELLEMIVEHLDRHHPERAVDVPAVAGALEPLRAAGLLVQEDLCLMAPGAAGYTLAAAFLAFPSRWRLHEKLGRPLRAIHAPVPGFADRLAAPAERLFDTLAAERPVWRANWSLHDDPSLFQPWGREREPQLAAADAGLHLWLRVERQTLRRLPASGHVVFTIRTLVRPLAEVAAVPEVAAAMAARLREMPEAVLRYKAMLAVREPLLAWLDGMVRDGPQQQPQALGQGGTAEP
jgi:hypothetical protein